MLTSKERAEFRTKSNGLDTLLIVGKGGVTPNLLAEAEILLDSRELVKGRVLETALLTAREASDQICASTGADGIQTVGSKFVIYRKSKKLEEKRKKEKKKTENPVRAGVQKRRKAVREERERKNEFFRQTAIAASIERQRQRQKKRKDG